MPKLVLAVIVAISIFLPAQREAPSVVGSRTFVSPEGGFSISLPSVTAFGPFTIPTPFADAKGDLLEWTTKEATFGVGYADAFQSLEDPTFAKLFFKLATDRFNKVAADNGGIVETVKEITLDKHPGIEQRIDLFTGTVIQRTYIVARRVYELVAVMKNEQRVNEKIAFGVLDSFKLLSGAEKKADQRAKAEPTPLPQTPVAPRAGSDATDEGLRGPVKSMATETRYETGQVEERYRHHYNEHGNLVRSEWYNEKGNLGSITLYGYIDGSRVSKVIDIEEDSDPRDIRVVVTPPPDAKKPDPRYQNKYVYKYDSNKRLTEQSIYLNNGKLFLRTAYKYEANQREQLDYADDGTVSQRVVYKLDDKGNEVQQTVFDEDGKARYKTWYRYEFDSKGNWTRRTATRLEIRDGREIPLRTAVDVRTFTYY